MFSTHHSLVLALLASSLALAAPSPQKITKRITTPYFQKYVAIGDSYASGIGAGEYTGNKLSQDFRCSRFTNAYPQQLHRQLNDPNLRNFQHRACAGATGEEVQQQSVDADADLITISAGGNNVGFGDLIDACVYRFRGYASKDCDKALDESEALIRQTSKLWQPVWSDIWQVYNSLHSYDRQNARLFLTGYPRFFNAETDQCDGASFSYWAVFANGEKMTKERRRRLNALVDMMNAKLQDVVDSWTNPSNKPNYWPNVQFINYDSAYDGHRLCENGVSEPQRGTQSHDSHNKNAWIFQINKSRNQEDLAGGNDEGRQWAEWIHQAVSEHPELQVAPAYKGLLPNDPGNDFSGGYPLPISKVFHPSTGGHKAIADAIMSAMSQAIKIDKVHKYGDVQYGPSKFCQGLSPGGGGSCMDIEEGCYIVVPEDNTQPKPVCD